jgi:predicted ATPase
MSQFKLKSIHPVNLLSFGPETEPIEIRQLNILIGANGSGKSNLIEAIRLLHFLPEKEPWGVVVATGGVGEWLWKSPKGTSHGCSLSTSFMIGNEYQESRGLSSKQLDFRIALERSGASFHVKSESLRLREEVAGAPSGYWFNRIGDEGGIGPALGTAFSPEPSEFFPLIHSRSIFSQLSAPSVQGSGLGLRMPEVFQAAEFIESFDFHQDWEFGVDCSPREPQAVGQPIERLEEDGANLAQLLAYYRDHHKPIFERLNELVARFYASATGVEIRLISTHLEIAVEEKGGFSTPGSRLSDGMLRWLYLLGILLNPSPPPVTCIDEPELGLHPDILPTLADLLREASTRTQLIVTTHSSTLIDAFSDNPESVCVTEKIDGSTVIRRLSQSDLEVWLKEYSLGSLWTSGQIGGNRW